MFERAWAPALGLASAVLRHPDAEEATVEGFARALERWHRSAGRPDPGARAVGYAAEAAVRVVKRTRARGGSATDARLGAALCGMPARVAVAFLLRHVGGYASPVVAEATGTSTWRADRRAARGLVLFDRAEGPGAREILHA